MLVHLDIANLRLLLQEEQQKMSANKAVVPEDQREAQKAGNKPTVVSKDGDTIYLGFDKGQVTQMHLIHTWLIESWSSMPSTCHRSMQLGIL
jgi:hypothetical protein